MNEWLGLLSKFAAAIKFVGHRHKLGSSPSVMDWAIGGPTQRQRPVNRPERCRLVSILKRGCECRTTPQIGGHQRQKNKKDWENKVVSKLVRRWCSEEKWIWKGKVNEDLMKAFCFVKVVAWWFERDTSVFRLWLEGYHDKPGLMLVMGWYKVMNGRGGICLGWDE